MLNKCFKFKWEQFFVGMSTFATVMFLVVFVMNVAPYIDWLNILKYVSYPLGAIVGIFVMSYFFNVLGYK